jgi:hypothetical protein
LSTKIFVNQGGNRTPLVMHRPDRLPSPRLSNDATHYRSGERIEAGDQISWHGSEGVVVFVVAELPADDWYRREFGQGFMLDVQGVGQVLELESGEDLVFLGSKS